MGEFQSFIGVDFWTALFTLLNFLTVFFVGRHYLWEPVTQMVRQRQKEIDEMYSEADAARTSAMAMEQEYRQKLSAAQAASRRLEQEAVARGQSREAEIIRQARREASAILDRAAADIAQEKKKAVNDAKDEISGLALVIAGKVVGRALTGADQSALVDRFINELGEQL